MGKTRTFDDREVIRRLETTLSDIESNDIIDPDALTVIELTRLIIKTVERGQQMQAFRTLNSLCFDARKESTNRIVNEGERRQFNG